MEELSDGVAQVALDQLLVLKRDVNSVPVAGTYYTIDIIK